jgi:hypothetical protein
MSRITEKRIYAIPQTPLIADGTNVGTLRVANTKPFMVGQIVKLVSSTAEAVDFKINRIDPIDHQTMYLGPLKAHISKRSDLSAYTVADGATIEACEQNRPTVPEQEIERATYEEEPAVARRVILVDPWGCRIDPDNPLPTTSVPQKLISKYSYGSNCMPEYAGEAEPGTSESANLWSIQRFDYDSNCNLVCTLRATNVITTKATEVTVDTASDAPSVRVEITGGNFDLAAIGDNLTINTTNNSWTASIISVLSSTEVLVNQNTAVDEAGTAIGQEDLTVELVGDGLSERRWDSRDCYIYA